MDNIKISLTILLPGSTMVSTTEAVKQLTRPVRKNGKVIMSKGQPVTETVMVPDFKTNDRTIMELFHKGKKETLEIFTRKSKEAKQVINMTQEAYDHFTSNFIPPKFKGNWKTMTPNQKVKWHCEQMAQEFGGKLESFQIFE